MNKRYMKLGSTPLWVAFFLFLFNYYLSSLILGEYYRDIFGKSQVNYGMDAYPLYLMFELAPKLALILSVVTVVFLYIFKRKKSIRSVTMLIHVVVFIVLIVTIVYVFVSLYFDGKIRHG